MKNKYKNNADAIKYLSALCDKEVQKPVEEMDCELIESTVELLLKLQSKKVSLTEKEIEEKVRKIPFTESSDNVKEFKVNKNVRTKTTQRRILLIAAVIAILVAILSFVSVAFEWDIHDIMKDKFGSVFNVPVGVEQNENGVTFINNGKRTKYNSIEEVLENEKITILLPENNTENLFVKSIINYTKNNTDEFFISFNNDAFNYTITVDNSIPKIDKDESEEQTTINGFNCYIDKLEDVNTIIIHFEYKGNYYKFTGNDKQILIDIIKNLEEQE